MTVDIDETENVTGVDKVRILDVRIYIPDFRPKPWVLEKCCRNVPQGVANLDDVFVWMAVSQRYWFVDALKYGFVLRRLRAGRY